MDFEEISPDEVQVGDWFECIRISRRKQKIAKIDRETGKLKTIISGGGKVEFDLDDSEITLYRNLDNPPDLKENNDETNQDETNQDETETTTDNQESNTGDPQDRINATEEQIQAVRDHLDGISGIGPSKIDSLIDAGFDTIKRLKDAEIEELTGVNGIGEEKAKDIKLSLI